MAAAKFRQIGSKGISTVGIILLIVLFLVLFGGHSYVNWGYGPSGLVGVLLIVVLVLVLTNRL